MTATTGDNSEREVHEPFESREVRARWWPRREVCVIIGESPGAPGEAYFYDPIPPDRKDPVGVRGMLLPALVQAGLIASSTLEAFRDAGFVFDHAIRRQIPMAVVRKERERALRYRSDWAARATHLVKPVEAFPVVWVMGRIARNAIATVKPATAVKRKLDPPYVLDAEPRLFFSTYFRPRFDSPETVKNVVAQFKRFLKHRPEWTHAVNMEIARLLQQRRREILEVAARRGARNVRIFGSVARGESDAASDIDFIVEMEPGRSLFDLGGLVMDLRELIGRQVDVVTEHGLKPRIRDRVLREASAL